jgi:hypothetical protein
MREGASRLGKYSGIRGHDLGFAPCHCDLAALIELELPACVESDFDLS